MEDISLEDLALKLLGMRGREARRQEVSAIRGQLGLKGCVACGDLFKDDKSLTTTLAAIRNEIDKCACYNGIYIALMYAPYWIAHGDNGCKASRMLIKAAGGEDPVREEEVREPNRDIGNDAGFGEEQFSAASLDDAEEQGRYEALYDINPSW